MPQTARTESADALNSRSCWPNIKFQAPTQQNVELVNAPFLKAGGSPAEYRGGLELAIGRGWLLMHESGTSPAGADLFA
jgi:hypothetical protein